MRLLPAPPLDFEKVHVLATCPFSRGRKGAPLRPRTSDPLQCTPQGAARTQGVDRGQCAFYAPCHLLHLVSFYGAVGLNYGMHRGID